MTNLERFQSLNPKVTKIRIRRDGDDITGWELFEGEERMGYGFIIKVPDQAFNIPDSGEYDIYEVIGIADTAFRIDSLDINLHEDYEGDLWAKEIVEDDYKSKYAGLEEVQIRVPPDGVVDVISGSTISCDAVTKAVREKLMVLEVAFKQDM